MLKIDSIQQPILSLVRAVTAAILLLISVAAVAEIRLLSTEEPPTNFTYAGNFTGTTTEMVREIRKRLGWSAKVEVYPWSRAYQIALNAPDVLVFTVGKTAEREQAGFTFIGPVSTRKHGVFSRIDQAVSDFDAMKDSQEPVAVMRGDWRAKYLAGEGFSVLDMNNHAQGFRMLMNGRINYWLSSDLEAPMTARSLGYRMADIKMVKLIRESGSYMAFSPGTNPELIQKWRGAFKELQHTDFFDQQRTLWSNILDAQIEYRPEAGYIVRY
ncbi:hypothetical protein DV711_11100 [Motiliproteus coralliicola]|uniref:Solute-binding protein family 3/N-terminal domain-containing protein n=1 Tax=Motiliproteus coralliicola TaxID=2283196 RepID=A0A369WFJ5_9GAMM|nr:transporter substrate-binding domain-containing protein [Motiliproteus coralliicola]RDE19434.1 hypothetical protein DV711_11100 [Motiliproteus coralliicola]